MVTSTKEIQEMITTRNVRKLGTNTLEIKEGYNRLAFIQWNQDAETFLIKQEGDIDNIQSGVTLKCDGSLAGLKRAAVAYINEDDDFKVSIEPEPVVKEEIQLQLDNMPKKRGRPSSGNAMSGAERAKKARLKKKETGIVHVSKSLESLEGGRYRMMLEAGLDLNSIVALAYAAFADVKYQNDDGMFLDREVEAIGLKALLVTKKKNAN